MVKIKIVQTINEKGKPICPKCKTPLIKIKEYQYKSNCKHISKNIIIAYLNKQKVKNE